MQNENEQSILTSCNRLKLEKNPNFKAPRRIPLRRDLRDRQMPNQIPACRRQARLPQAGKAQMTKPFGIQAFDIDLTFGF